MRAALLFCRGLTAPVAVGVRLDPGAQDARGAPRPLARSPMLPDGIVLPGYGKGLAMVGGFCLWVRVTYPLLGKSSR